LQAILVTDQPINTYPYPVSRLLNLGDPRERREWPVYVALGLKAEHVPDLIRMITDEDLHNTLSDAREVWAPLHAWRALGQLRAEAAIEPLLSLLWRIDDEGDDWVGEELPRVFSMIGGAAIPALSTYLADDTHGEYARVAAAYSLEWIARRYAAERDRSVSALSAQLQRFHNNPPTVNAFLISYLVDLEAIEAAPLMEQAFAANQVDLVVRGDWEEIQIDLGLKTKRDTPRKNWALETLKLDQQTAKSKKRKQR
jgi:HEAT repeat protein